MKISKKLFEANKWFNCPTCQWLEKKCRKKSRKPSSLASFSGKIFFFVTEYFRRDLRSLKHWKFSRTRSHMFTKRVFSFARAARIDSSGSSPRLNSHEFNLSRSVKAALASANWIRRDHFLHLERLQLCDAAWRWKPWNEDSPGSNSTPAFASNSWTFSLTVGWALSSDIFGT